MCITCLIYITVFTYTYMICAHFCGYNILRTDNTMFFIKPSGGVIRLEKLAQFGNPQSLLHLQIHTSPGRYFLFSVDSYEL